MIARMAANGQVALRLLSYNVRTGGGAGAAAVIDACAPDVACLQEAPRFWRWRSARARLARESGLLVATTGSASGVAVLASLRAQLVHEETVGLSRIPGMEPRSLAVAVLEFVGAGVVVASVHLDLRAPARQSHAREVLDHLDRVHRRFGYPAIVAGDLNEQPGEPAWSAFEGRYRDAYADAPSGGGPTFPAARPSRRIDAVFVDAAVEVRGCGVPAIAAHLQRAASDHLPVLAELAVPALTPPRRRRDRSPAAGRHPSAPPA